MSNLEDTAQEVEMATREAALAEQAHRFGSYFTQGFSFSNCQEESCGEEIPEARRRALPGVRLCLDCAILREKRNLK